VFEWPEQSHEIERVEKPPWADSIEVNNDGLHLAVNNKRFYWHHHHTDGISNVSSRGFWYSSHPSKLERPKWAASVGRDSYGAYADLVINQVSQRFRWIEPGEFRMGSPTSDRSKEKKESRRLIRITKGFWFAETACAQEFWTAVRPLDQARQFSYTRKNPSYFTDPNCPVEQVSWTDVNEFIDDLNIQVPSLTARLPTEAEWEYGCRAGSETLFTFGDKAENNSMNFQDTNINTTVNVRRFHPNRWGLYQMHGNVWEWCKDWYETFKTVTPDVVESNPEGPPDADTHSLRGGSYRDEPRFCQSSFRFSAKPQHRSPVIGFRLVVDQQLLNT
jgi:formylglycine-generating enzyme